MASPLDNVSVVFSGPVLASLFAKFQDADSDLEGVLLGTVHCTTMSAPISDDYDASFGQQCTEKISISVQSFLSFGSSLTFYNGAGVVDYNRLQQLTTTTTTINSRVRTFKNTTTKTATRTPHPLANTTSTNQNSNNNNKVIIVGWFRWRNNTTTTSPSLRERTVFNQLVPYITSLSTTTTSNSSSSSNSSSPFALFFLCTGGYSSAPCNNTPYNITYRTFIASSPTQQQPQPQPQQQPRTTMATTSSVTTTTTIPTVLYSAKMQISNLYDTDSSREYQEFAKLSPAPSYESSSPMHMLDKLVAAQKAVVRDMEQCFAETLKQLQQTSREVLDSRQKLQEKRNRVKELKYALMLQQQQQQQQQQLTR